MRQPFSAAATTALALSLLLLVSLTSSLRADDAPKPELAQVGMVAAKSVDALTAFAKLTGIPLPPNVSAEGLETQFPFIGKGGLVTDMPLGIAYCGGPDVKDPSKGIVFVFPVKPTAATLDALKAQGATPVADHPDTVLLGGSGMRRTADYLLFSPTPAAVSLVNIGAIGDAVKGGDVLVRLSLDLKSIRRNMPDQYKQTLDMALNGAGPDAAKDFAPLLKSFETIDRVEASLESGEKGVRLAFTSTPVKMPALTGKNLPGMPPGIFTRFDFGAAIVDAYPQVRDNVTALVKKSQDEPTANQGKPYSDDQKKQVESLITRLTNFLIEPTATSVGVEMIGQDPVFYIAQHLSKPIDMSAELQKLVNDSNTLEKATESPDKQDSLLQLQVYQSDGVRVLRTIGMDHGKPEMYIDLVQKGDDVYITICPNQYRYIHKLMAAKEEGPIANVYSASLDLEKAATSFLPMTGMAADKGKELVTLLAGQKFSIASTSEGDSATLELTVTKGVLQNAPKIAALFGLGGGEAAPPAAK